MTDTPFLGIATPHLYRCHLHYYHSRLSRLYVRCFKGLLPAPAQAAAFYLLFADVAYLDTPVNWQGVGFVVAPAEDCLALLAALHLIDPAYLADPDTRAALAESTQLYHLSTPQHTVRIVAGAVSRLEHLPAELS